MDTATLAPQDGRRVLRGRRGPGRPVVLAPGRGQGSIARAALDAAIRGRVGLKSRAVYSARTFGELEAELVPGAAAAPAPAAAPGPATVAAGPASTRTSGAVSCGVDIELIANLPVAADPWEDAFYRTTFAPAEIAYCLMQETPALHFAARWCAKEALKKCDRAFLAAGPEGHGGRRPTSRGALASCITPAARRGGSRTRSASRTRRTRRSRWSSGSTGAGPPRPPSRPPRPPPRSLRPRPCRTRRSGGSLSWP